MTGIAGWQSGAMHPWNSSSESDLRRLLNEWDPIGVADFVQDEYDCMLAPLLRQLCGGAGQAEIGEYLRHELEDHFGLDPEFQRTDVVAAGVITWWTRADPADDTGRM